MAASSRALAGLLPRTARGHATMRAAVYREFRGRIQVEEVPRPSAPPDGVVVEVAANGLCRSDWHGWQGHDGDITSLPHVPGHELSGIVAEVGSQVVGFSVGDRVTTPFILSCGHCAECVTHRRATTCTEQLQPGFHLWGSYAEYVALPRADRNLLHLPREVDFRAGASIGCRFSTAYRGLASRAQLQPREQLCVMGCGGLGLAAVVLGKALGARVTACDVRPEALKRATELGADAVVLVTDTLEEEVREATEGGAHVSIETSGSSAAVSSAVQVLRRGGRMVQAGLPLGGDAGPRLPMAKVVGWELQLLGAHGANTEELKELLSLAQRGYVRPEVLVTEDVSLSQACVSLMNMGSSPPTGVHMITDFQK